MRKSTETDLVNACLELLHLCGIYCWRNNTGALPVGKRFIRFGRSGSADILGCLPGGQFLAVETKVGKNPLTPAQAHFLDTVRTAGGTALVVRDLIQLQDWLALAGLWRK